MSEWLALLDINSVMLGLLIGLLLGLVALTAATRIARRHGAAAEADRLLPAQQETEALLEQRTTALADVRRGIAMFRETEVPVLGVVENFGHSPLTPALSPLGRGR